MFKWKKAAAALAAAAMTVAGAGCTVGSGSAYAMTIDGEQINAGIYIYYSYASYMELTQTLQSQNSKLDVKDDNVVKEQKMDGVSSEEWIKNKALEYCQRYVAIEKKFDELDLSLTEEESKEMWRAPLILSGIPMARPMRKTAFPRILSRAFWKIRI